MPTTIVITPDSFGNPMHAGVPIRLFLQRFPDRDVYYLIGSHPNVSPGN